MHNRLGEPRTAHLAVECSACLMLNIGIVVHFFKLIIACINILRIIHYITLYYIHIAYLLPGWYEFVSVLIGRSPAERIDVTLERLASRILCR